MWPIDQMAAREHWELAVEKYRRVGDTRMLAYALPKAAIGYLGDREQVRSRDASSATRASSCPGRSATGR